MTTYSTNVKSIPSEDIASKTYDIFITTDFVKTKPEASLDFENERDSCVLSRLGKKGDIQTGIIPSNFSMSLIATDSTREAALNGIYTNSDDTWYVLIFKDDAFYWWGYLQTDSSSIDREYKPRYLLYAYDKITLAGTQKFWDYTPTPRGIAPRNSIFGMGWRKNVDPSTTSQIPQFGTEYDPRTFRTTSILGIVYSCLFDTDAINLGEQDLNVVNWDVHNPVIDVAGITRSLENVGISVDDYFFNDPVNFTYNGGVSGQDNKDWIIADILEEICKWFRARLFQKDGEYYFVQWEAYRGDPAAGNMRVHTYRNSVRATPVVEVVFPDHKFTTVVTYNQSLAAPRTNPKTQGVTSVEKNKGAEIVRYKFRGSPLNDSYTVLERSLSNPTVTNGRFSNFTEAARRVIEKTNEWGFSNMSFLVYNGSGTLINISQSFGRYDGTTYQVKNLMEHLTDVTAEYNNGIRNILNVTMIGDYDFFNSITLDSVTYLPTSETFNLMRDTHKVDAIQFQKNNSNLGVIVAGGHYEQPTSPDTGIKKN